MAKRVIYNGKNPAPSTPLGPFEETRTRQSEAAACNINNIMRRYEKTGVIPPAKRNAFYADVSTMGDYRTALHQVQSAQDYFMSLPAKLRSRFENDAAAFLDFVSDPANRDEMVELGLIESADDVPDDGGEAAPEVPPPASE